VERAEREGEKEGAAVLDPPPMPPEVEDTEPLPLPLALPLCVDVPPVGVGLEVVFALPVALAQSVGAEDTEASLLAPEDWVGDTVLLRVPPTDDLVRDGEGEEEGEVEGDREGTNDAVPPPPPPPPLPFAAVAALPPLGVLCAELDGVKEGTEDKVGSLSEGVEVKVLWEETEGIGGESVAGLVIWGETLPLSVHCEEPLPLLLGVLPLEALWMPCVGVASTLSVECSPPSGKSKPAVREGPRREGVGPEDTEE
jgi:hypothetical protein